MQASLNTFDLDEPAHSQGTLWETLDSVRRSPLLVKGLQKNAKTTVADYLNENMAEENE